MNFDELNEAAVREAIIAPLLQELGYRIGSENNIRYEQQLRYPLIFHGRKNRERDKVLRGRADYILEAGREVRWVIEAKPPEEISQDDIEQAYCYANHAEVRAVYFVLCNGRELIVFQTNRGPACEPLFREPYDNYSSGECRQVLHNLLSPTSILRDHKSQTLDLGVPIGPNLKSHAQVIGGNLQYLEMMPCIRPLLALQVSVIGGVIERGTDGALVAEIESRAPVRTIDAFMQKNGLSRMRLRSEDKYLSTDPCIPTIFRYSEEVTFPAGAMLADPMTWGDVQLPVDLQVAVEFEAQVVLQGSELVGVFAFTSTMDCQFLVKANGNVSVSVS